MPSPEPGPDRGGDTDTGTGARAAPDVVVSQEGDVCRVSGAIDFGNARKALEAVGPLIERGAVGRVDLGGITRSNSAGLALMIEWLGMARRAGHPLGFDNVPDGLRQLAGVCQVEALIAV